MLRRIKELKSGQKVDKNWTESGQRRTLLNFLSECLILLNN